MTRPIGVKPERSKVDRMAAQSAKIEAGHVHLPNSPPWLGEFLTELLSFPNGRHDDQVDSASQFLRWLQNDAYNQIPFAAPIIITRADMGGAAAAGGTQARAVRAACRCNAGSPRCEPHPARDVRNG
jgi:hypothetical protein